jgi:hypothetical protein
MARRSIAKPDIPLITSDRFALGDESISDRAIRAVALLAHGILQQYSRCKNGEVVGRSGNGAPGTGIPLPLRQAQGQLARLALEEGSFDTFSSVHQLLANCQQPLRKWAPSAVATLPTLADLVLIDPDYRVPTEECETQASEQPGSYADMVEGQLFEELKAALGEYPDEVSRDVAYTLVRSFIAEYPLATREELSNQTRDKRLNDQAAEFLQRAYEPVHASEAHQRQVPRCANCRARLSVETGECTLTSCRYLHPKTASTEPLFLATAFQARPELLRYWTDPAQEELRVYRELQAVFGSNKVLLYPHHDRCDVALGESWAIDVKDHYDPQRLASQLNDHLGGMLHYPPGQRILAIATRRAAQPNYLKYLRQALKPEVRRTIEVLSVKATIQKLKKIPHGSF